MIKLLAGTSGCCQKYDNDKKFNLANIETFHITNANQPTGRNFNAVENQSGWMTGIRVFGDNMYISNRGNGNFLDDTIVHMSTIPITNVTGTPTAKNAIDNSGNIGNCDGFDIDPTGTHVLIAGFSVNRIYSAQLTTAFDFSTITSFSTGPSTSVRPRAVTWDTTGLKYYWAGGVTASSSDIKEYNCLIPFTISSSDVLAGTKTLSGSSAYNALSDMNFSSDGTKMWLSSAAGYLFYGELSTAWDITTLSIVDTVNFNSFFSTYSPARTNTNTFHWICGMHWNEDGTKLYINSLWGQTDSLAVSGVLAPLQVIGTSGAPANDPNTFAVIEFRRK